MAVTYEQAKKDHATLWAIDSANDMTGGYVDSQDLDRLLKNPTKATARACFVEQIEYWFATGIPKGADEQVFESRELQHDHPEIIEIAERHNCEHWL